MSSAKTTLVLRKDFREQRPHNSNPSLCSPHWSLEGYGKQTKPKLAKTKEVPSDLAITNLHIFT
jgi:hypothetical protein